MKETDRDLVRDLLNERRVLALSVLVEGRPFVGQLPFAAAPDFGALLVHASSLARHSQGLAAGAAFSALVQAPDSPGSDPFQMPRLTVNGTVKVLAKGTDEYFEAKEHYLEKLPSGGVTFSLGDFVLYALEVEKARLVAGFGRTANLTPGALREASAGASDPAASHSEPEAGA